MTLEHPYGFCEPVASESAAMRRIMEENPTDEIRMTREDREPNPRHAVARFERLGYGVDGYHLHFAGRLYT